MRYQRRCIFQPRRTVERKHLALVQNEAAHARAWRAPCRGLDRIISVENHVVPSIRAGYRHLREGQGLEVEKGPICFCARPLKFFHTAAPVAAQTASCCRSTTVKVFHL